MAKIKLSGIKTYEQIHVFQVVVFIYLAVLENVVVNLVKLDSAYVSQP